MLCWTSSSEELLYRFLEQADVDLVYYTDCSSFVFPPP